MAKKTFALRTEPHVAVIGDVELLFQPEVDGAEFLNAYEELRETQHQLGVLIDDLTELAPDQLRKATAAVRAFIARWMLPESAEKYTTMNLPTRIQVDLLEWLMGEEVYGTPNRPTGPSNGSATASSPRLTRGTATSRSKASTRARGR